MFIMSYNRVIKVVHINLYSTTITIFLYIIYYYVGTNYYINIKSGYGEIGRRATLRVLFSI